MKKKIVYYYGLENHPTSDNENIEITHDDFRIAFCNLNLTIKDGLPSKIPIKSLNAIENRSNIDLVDILDDYLYVGSIGSAYNIDKLLATGITHILCLSSVIRLKFPEHFKYLRINIVDQIDYNFLDDLPTIFDFIIDAKKYSITNNNSSIVTKGKILIHCYQGKSRSIAICCAYLIKYYNYTLNDALELIRQVRLSDYIIFI